MGLTTARAAAVLSLARAVVDGAVDLAPGGNPDVKMASLERLAGIGPWTAQYIAMRVFAWPDAFPASDLGIRKALGETNLRRVLDRAEPWRPWRAYAAMHLWKSLDKRP